MLRVVPVELLQPTTKALDEVAAKMRLADVSLVYDVYALLYARGAVNLSEDRLVKAFSKAAPMTLLFAKRRAALLRALRSSVVFTAIISDPKRIETRDDRVSAVLELFGLWAIRLGKKVASACEGCTLRPDCTFGSQYANSSLALAPADALLPAVHANCPIRPSLADESELRVNTEKMNREIISGVRSVPRIVRSSFGSFSACSEATISAINTQAAKFDRTASSVLINEGSGPYDSAHCGGIFSEYAGRGLANALLAKDELLEMFDFARALSDRLVEARAGTMMPQKDPDSEDKSLMIIDRLSDVSRVITREHAKPEHMFLFDLARRNMRKRDSAVAHDKRHLFYLLVDATSSMRTSFQWSKQHERAVSFQKAFGAYASPATLSSVLCASLLQLVRKEEALLFMRYFAGRAAELLKASPSNPASYDALNDIIVSCSYGGTSTNIGSALSSAVGDIVQVADEDLRDAEILLITDGYSSMSFEDLVILKAALGAGNVRLNTLLLSGSHSEESLLAQLRTRSQWASSPKSSGMSEWERTGLQAFDKWYEYFKSWWSGPMESHDAASEAAKLSKAGDPAWLNSSLSLFVLPVISKNFVVIAPESDALDKITKVIK